MATIGGAEVAQLSEDRLRIDHVVASIDQPGNGVSEAVRGLALAESRQGADVHVHTLGPGSSQPGIRVRGYRHARFPHPALLRSPDLRCGLLASAEAAGVIHTHNLWTLPVVYAAEAAAKSVCPLVCSIHGALHPRSLEVSWLQKAAMWALTQRRTLGRVDVFRATSLEEAAYIRARGLPTPVAVVPNGVEAPIAVLSARKPGLCRIGFLGRLHPIKAVDRLVDAWRAIAVRRPAWELCICGPDGGMERDLRIRAAGVPRVVFEPPISSERKAAWYASCDLVVLPSHAENFGMVVAEALAHGVPVVASTGTPWREVASHASGWWVDNDVDSLRETLLQATGTDEGELRVMGRRGHDWMLRDFSWASVAARMMSVYRWLAGDAPKPVSLLVD